MSTVSTEKLYTPEILGLAVELARFPLDSSLSFTSEARAQSCGSTLKISLNCYPSGTIEATGMQVTACAIGQASAAIFARHAVGNDVASLDTVLTAIEHWLGGDDTEPCWPEIGILAPARAYPARHGAILLPWRAAIRALSKA